MRPKSAGLLGEDLADFIRLLGPHLKRAFQIQKKLATLRTASESPKTALDHWDTGVIAVDRSRRVLMVNSAAERILKSGRAVTVSRYRLVAINHSQQDQLERLIKAAAMTGAGLGTASGGAILLLGKDSNPISVVATPFRSGRLFTEDRPCALLFITDPKATPASRVTLLRGLFGLTPAECRLVALLFEGDELRNAAERMHITVDTARFMLKRVFHKTLTKRQSHLIRLLSSLPGELGQSDRNGKRAG
jgi:DNA-binding CsgD family transcriptional regulator